MPISSPSNLPFSLTLSSPVLVTFVALSLVACGGSEGGDDPVTTAFPMTTGPGADTGAPVETGTGDESETGDSDTRKGEASGNGEAPTTDDPDAGDDGDTGDEESGTTGEPMEEPFVHTCENEMDDDDDSLQDCADPGCFNYAACTNKPLGEFINADATSNSERYLYLYSFAEDGSCARQAEMAGEMEECTYKVEGEGTLEDPWTIKFYGTDDEFIEEMEALSRHNTLRLRSRPTFDWELFESATTYEGSVSGVPAEYVEMGPMDTELDVYTALARTKNYAWEVSAEEGQTLTLWSFEPELDKGQQLNVKFLGPLEAAEEEQSLTTATNESGSGRYGYSFAAEMAGKYLMLVSTAYGGEHRLRLRRSDAEDKILHSALVREDLVTPTGQPDAVHTVDLNGDDLLDLVVATADSSSNLLVYLQGETGTLATAATYAYAEVAESSEAFDILSADVNDDGEMDVLVSHTNGVSVLLGEGEGVLGVYSEMVESEEGETGGESVQPLAGARMAMLSNKAGAVELAMATPQMLARYKGDKDGNFSEDDSVETVAEERFALATGDLDGDGTLDVAFTSGTAEEPSFFTVDGVSWELKQTKLRDSAYDYSVHAIAIGDVDGKGAAEVVVGHRGYSGNRTIPSQVAIYRRSSSGSYNLDQSHTGITEYNEAGGMTGDLRIVDLDGDGQVEIIFIWDKWGARRIGERLGVMRYREGGWLTQYYGVPDEASKKMRGYALGDLNGDACSDITAIVSRTSGASVELFAGHGCKE